MSWYARDGVIYLIVIASAYYAYYSIPDTLNHIRNLAACPEPTGPGPRKQLQSDAENAIGLDTLRVLSDGNSYALRSSTIKIVASRTIKSNTKKLLLKDLASTDEDKRYRAICGLWMLIYHPSLQRKRIREKFLDYDTFYAIVTGLKNVLAEHRTEQIFDRVVPENPMYPETELPPSPIRPPMRPHHEQSLLAILNQLIETPRSPEIFNEYPNNTTCAVAAGLVTRWLKDYPFPCALPQNMKYNYKKEDVYSLCQPRAWAWDDFDMARLIIHIGRTSLGSKQLQDAGLRKSTITGLEELGSRADFWRQFPTRLDTLDLDSDVRMVNGESTAGAITPPPIARRRESRVSEVNVPHARSHDWSVEEEALRRRRREAVVVVEPGAPLNQRSILQRTDSGGLWRANTNTPTATGTESPPSMSGDSISNRQDNASTIAAMVPTITMSSAASQEGSSTLPPLPPNLEDRFSGITQPLLDLTRDIAAMESRIIMSDWWSAPRVAQTLTRVRDVIDECGSRMRRSIRRWNVPRHQRRAALRRLSNALGELTHRTRPARVGELLAMRAASSDNGGVGGSSSGGAIHANENDNDDNDDSNNNNQ